VLIPQLFWSQLYYSGLKSGISFLGKRYFVVAMDWQSGDSDNNGSDNSRSYESPEYELGYLLHKRGGGLEKVQMNETPIIFLRKRYGSVVVRIQS
jgi:hypothetical protein